MTLFRTTLKRCLKKPVILFTLLILPIVCLLIDYPYQGSNNVKALNNITLAIADEDHSSVSKALIEKISFQYDIQKTNRSEINTLLTNQTCDWAIVIPKGFQKNLELKQANLIQSYGYAQKEKWEPVKLNIENMVASLKVLSQTKKPNTQVENLKVWEGNTKNKSFHFLERTRGPLEAGIGLKLYAIIILYGSYLLSRMFVEDKESELVVRIATTPIPPWRYLLEYLACFSAILIGQNIITILAYMVINPHGLEHPLFVLCTFIAYSIMAVGLMLTISTICRTSFIMMCASTGVIMLLSLIGGQLFPIKMMPESMKKIAMITPTYWFSEAIDSIFAASSQFTYQFFMLVGFAIVFFLVGSWKKYSTLN